jgi:predicted dehydrogenase
VNVGILGAGGIADKMARTLGLMEKTRAWAVASRDYGRAKALADKYQIQKAYGSYEEMLQDPKIDLVYIATPHSLHYEHMKLALTQGKHVLCEKAFTVNSAQAEEILNLGQQKKLLVAEAIWTRYLPIGNIINGIINSGAIGKAHCLTAVFSKNVSQMERLVRPELAGGALLDLGVYAINFALMTFGGDIEYMQSSMVPGKTGVDAMNQISFIYSDRKMALLHTSMQAIGDTRCTVNGEKGFMVIEPILNARSVQVFDAAHDLLARSEAPPQLTGYEYQFESCRKVIESGGIECPEMPHAEILKVMRIMDAARKSWGLVYPGE